MSNELVQATLAEEEVIIERAATSYIEAGQALTRIRGERKYKEAGFNTFGEYIRVRWGWSHQHANRQMRAAEAALEIEPTGSKPATERQARAQLAAQRAPDNVTALPQEREEPTEPVPARSASVSRLPQQTPKPSDDGLPARWIAEVVTTLSEAGKWAVEEGNPNMARHVGDLIPTVIKRLKDYGERLAPITKEAK